ncbi:hypothetical protein AN477_18020 [Alicyclobacillus ferrooxydans]|uniref:Formimidoylglutamase n=1 Tax=Alicyclobacillus ferrooxydans TaxID=471514 RepID=A0A0P9CS02_9BACL|nr:hypothetical protein AN477_18020 [Alicyclobacillus ferrooxydans]
MGNSYAGTGGGSGADDGRPDSGVRKADSFDAAILGVPISKTSISHSAAFRLPDAIRSTFHSFSPYNMNRRLDLSEVLHVVDVGNVQMHLTDLQLCHQRIEDAVKSYWQSHSAPVIVLGGDHSITGAAMLGLTQATERTYGVIHFDAHHDVRNLEDGGRSNGTPFRTLLSSGAVSGKHVIQIGLRDYVNARAYHEYVLQHGVTVVTAREVHHRGLMRVLEEAYRIVSDGTDAVYLSFDMDVLDQSHVPGVPAPGPGGLAIYDVIEALEWLGAKPNIEMMDIVCADPSQDFRDLTTRVAANVVLSFLTGLAMRKQTAVDMG